jgi:hypothetical protein
VGYIDVSKAALLWQQVHQPSAAETEAIVSRCVSRVCASVANFRACRPKVRFLPLPGLKRTPKGALLCMRSSTPCTPILISPSA